MTATMIFVGLLTAGLFGLSLYATRRGKKK